MCIGTWLTFDFALVEEEQANGSQVGLYECMEA